MPKDRLLVFGILDTEWNGVVDWIHYGLDLHYRNTCTVRESDRQGKYTKQTKEMR